MTNCSRKVHQPPHNHGQTDHGLKQINHGKVIGNILVGDTHKNYGTQQSATIGGGYLNTTRSFTGGRWTQLMSVSPAVVNPCFPARVNLPVNLSLHWLARSNSSGRRKWGRHKWRWSEYTKTLFKRSTLEAFSSWKALNLAKKYGALTAPSVKLFVAGRHFRLPVVRADHSRDVCACSRVDFFVEARARVRGCGPLLRLSWMSRTLRP